MRTASASMNDARRAHCTFTPSLVVCGACRLTRFYRSSAAVRVPFLEHLVAGPRNPHAGTYRLQPVGVAYRAPTTQAEARQLLSNVLTALEGIRTVPSGTPAYPRNGWCLVDVRWSNVVWAAGAWHLIDAEHVTPLGLPVPAVGHIPAGVVTASHILDLYMLHRMVTLQVPGLVLLMQQGPEGTAFLVQLQQAAVHPAGGLAADAGQTAATLLTDPYFAPGLVLP